MNTFILPSQFLYNFYFEMNYGDVENIIKIHPKEKENNMKTVDYVKKYGLGIANKVLSQSEKDELFIDLNNELLERISEREKVQPLDEKMFHVFVKQVNDKFWAISNKKNGPPFTPDLWNAFYAVKVIKIRNKYFPELEKMRLPKI